jgi:hypothetical protein
MPETKLTADEAQVLRGVLSALVIRTRTGELGIVHGAERFVSTQRTLKKAERDALDAAARKLGLSGIREHAG